ncbi:glycosyltransferase family 32 protein [Butyrivibrio sp. MB2005]|uniref:glycosyltransferase family 32 protein n=1 Tax=Butyrivibrio sp. MB2005 TaxID=1280678 RepID=UPI000401C715|nr:glycosyltransferase [Butyrivibrio sp. MB2005]
MDNKQYIPHTIHYFWMGGAPKPESFLKYLEGWRKFCPNFEIKEWNESNYDIHKHPYMEKAYNDKKWAFVSDYARLDVLYQYGGIYLDTDVEVLKDLSPLCEYKAFIGFENREIVNDGQGFGCAPGMPIFKEMLDCYDGEEPYEIIDGIQEYIESPKQRTKVLLRHGLKQDGSRQTVDGVEIFPIDYFCPLDYDTGRLRISQNTFSIHHFDESWHGKNTEFYAKIRQMLNRVLGVKLGRRIFSRFMKTKDSFKKLIGR